MQNRRQFLTAGGAVVAAAALPFGAVAATSSPVGKVFNLYKPIGPYSIWYSIDPKYPFQLRDYREVKRTLFQWQEVEGGYRLTPIFDDAREVSHLLYKEWIEPDYKSKIYPYVPPHIQLEAFRDGTGQWHYRRETYPIWEEEFFVNTDRTQKWREYAVKYWEYFGPHL